MEDQAAPVRKPLSTNKKFVSSVLAIALVVGGFYWYQIRPYEVRSDCAVESGARAFMTQEGALDTKGVERLHLQNESFETYYHLCVRSRGLAN